MVMIFFVCAGRSLFQVSAMLGRIVVDKDRMDAAYSIRYTLMNVGGFLGTFSLGILYKEKKNDKERDLCRDYIPKPIMKTL